MKFNSVAVIFIGLFLLMAPYLLQGQKETAPERFLPMPLPKMPVSAQPGDDTPVHFDQRTQQVEKGAAHQEILDLTEQWLAGDKSLLASEPVLAVPQAESFSALVALPFEQTSQYPASAVTKLYMTFPNGAMSSCSGTLIDPKHVLTAGHCIFNRERGGWAKNVRAIPAYQEENKPFGEVNSVGLLSWQGWTQGGAAPDDMGVVELERPIGAITGWLGYGYNNNDLFFLSNTFISVGYPGVSPFNGQKMYHWSGTYDFIDWTNGGNILYHFNRSYGGQSGSSSYYKNLSDQRFVMGILSHGAAISIGPTGHTRLNQYKFNNISQYISAHTPINPDLTPLFVRSWPNTVKAGRKLDSLKFVVTNYALTAFNGAINVEFRLSADPQITASDILLGSTSFAPVQLGSKKSSLLRVNGTSLSIPYWLTPGQYYIGVLIKNNDANTGNNGTIGTDSYQITINAANLMGDSAGDRNADEASDAGVFELSPNPSNGAVKLTYRLGLPSPVDIEVFDLTGRLVTRQHNDQEAGEHNAELNLEHVPNGVYLVRFQSSEQISTQKLEVQR